MTEELHPPMPCCRLFVRVIYCVCVVCTCIYNVHIYVCVKEFIRQCLTILYVYHVYVYVIDWFWLPIFHTNLVRGPWNKEMKFQNKRAVLVQIAPLFISQPRNQNQSIYQCMCTEDSIREYRAVDYLHVWYILYMYMYMYIYIHIYMSVENFNRQCIAVDYLYLEYVIYD